eukprot:UN23628
MAELVCIVVSGRNLVNKDFIGKSDPYVKLTLGSETLKSNTVQNSLDPLWQKSLSFSAQSWSLLEKNIESGGLVAEVYDEDDGQKDDCMGQAIIDLKGLSLGGSAIDKWYPLEKTGRMSKVSGEIRLKIYAKLTTQLSVTIPYANNLKNADLLDKSDPFVVVSYKSVSHKSKVVTNSLNPRWDE